MKTCRWKPATAALVEVDVISIVYTVKGARVIQCNFRDISERKELEDQKADFYAMVTHDVKSPSYQHTGLFRTYDGQGR